MKLIKNNQVIDASEIVTLYPNLTGPNVAAENGWEVLWPTTAEFDPMTQYAQEIAPAQDEKGFWRQQWQVLPLTPAQIAEKAEQLRISKIPVSVSPRQIRQALTAASLRTPVETAVAAGDQDTKDWWEFATVFERQHSMVLAMAASLGVTERQLDDLWTLAGSL